MISISSNFDAGAIDVANAASSADIQLNIRADSHAEFRQWFYFRLQGARGEPCTIRFLNAGACRQKLACAKPDQAYFSRLRL